MKKLIVVLAALLLVAGLAVTAMAADPVKFSGEFDYSIMSDFNNSTQGFANYYVDIDMTVDEYNSVLLEVWGEKGSISQGVALEGGYFALTTDVGKAFDLPIGLKTKAGITSIYSRKFEVSGHAWERPIRPAIDPIGIVGVADINGKATINVGFGLDQAGILVGIPAIGPASIEAYYMAPGGTTKGQVGGNVKATGLLNDMLSVAGMFAMDMDSEVYYWGAGASVKYNIVTAGVSASGYKDFVFNRLAIDVDAKFTDMIGATVAAGLYLDDPVITDTFGGADLSLYVTPGKSTWRVGYVITDVGYTYGSNAALLEGGLYISAGIDF